MKHKTGQSRAAPRTPRNAQGGPQTSPRQEAGCRATQGSHSARAAGSTARATVATDQRKTGKILSPRSPPGSPATRQPSWLAWCKGRQTSLERVRTAAHETRQDLLLPQHQFRSPDSSARRSVPPALAVGLDRASSSGFGVRRVQRGEEGNVEGGREKITAQL